jgi:hypothetical protein
VYFELLNTVEYYCRSRTLCLDNTYKEMNSRLPDPENVTPLMFSCEKVVASSRLVTKSTNAHERKTRCAKGTPRCAPRPKSRLLPGLKITPTVKVRPSGVTSQSKGSRDVHRTYVVGHVTTDSRPGMSQHTFAPR